VFEKALGYNPKFSGRIIIPGPNEARDSDSVRLRYDNENLDCGHTVVYWSDGSYNGECLGAGVAWLEGDAYYSQSFKLGKGVGNSADAEIYGIAAALSMAKKEVKRKQEIRIVKVYSDAQWVLEEIRLGYSSNLGPLIVDDDQSALQDIYERAKWLTAKGVDVELIWLKGHHLSKGNIMADEAAGEATKRQMWPKARLGRIDASHIEDLEIGFRDMATFSDDSWGSEDDRPDSDRSEDDRSEDDDQECEPKQHPKRDNVAPSLPDLSRIAVEKAIDDIRGKLKSMDAKISKLEEGYIDRHGRVHFGFNRMKLKQLDKQREEIFDSLQDYEALNAIDIKISKLEEGQIDSHGRVHFGFNPNKLKHLDKQRERILSSLRVYDAERVAQGTGNVDKSTLVREASSMPTTRSMAPAYQSKEGFDDMDMIVPEAELNPLVAAGSTLSSHQSEEEHDEVDKGMPDEEPKSSFVARATYKPHWPSALSSQSPFSSHQSMEKSNDTEISAPDDEPSPFLAGCSLFSAHRSNEKFNAAEKGALIEAGSTLVPRPNSSSSSHQCEEDSDDEGIQYLIDMQIENDMLMAARYNTCKLLLLRLALLFEYCFASCFGSCFKRCLSTSLSVVRVHLFESLHG
jgi:ribonuclease HI